MGRTGEKREQDEPRTPDTGSLVVGNRWFVRFSKCLVRRRSWSEKRLVIWSWRPKVMGQEVECSTNSLPWSQQDETLALSLACRGRGWGVVLDMMGESWNFPASTSEMEKLLHLP